MVQIRPTKVCNRCGKTKPLTEYYTAYTRKDGSKLLMQHCKACNKAKTREYRQAQTEEYRATERAKARRFRENNPDYYRALKLKRKYGLSTDEWEQMLQDQDGRCPICLRDLATLKVCVDHDHTDHHVRGLLCDVCNVGLGMFKDNPDHLRRAVEYLLRSALPQ